MNEDLVPEQVDQVATTCKIDSLLTCKSIGDHQLEKELTSGLEATCVPVNTITLNATINDLGTVTDLIDDDDENLLIDTNRLDDCSPSNTTTMTSAQDVIVLNRLVATSNHNTQSSCSATNTALKPATLSIVHRTTTTNDDELATSNNQTSCSFLEDVLSSKSPSSLVSSSSTIRPNDDRTNNVVNGSIYTIRASASSNSSKRTSTGVSSNASRQGVRLERLEHFERSETVADEEEEEVASSLVKGIESLDGVPTVPSSSTSSTRNTILDCSTIGKSVLIQNTVRVQSNSISECLNYTTSNQQPDHSNSSSEQKQRCDLSTNCSLDAGDLTATAAEVDRTLDHCSSGSVINLRTNFNEHVSDKEQQPKTSGNLLSSLTDSIDLVRSIDLANLIDTVDSIESTTDHLLSARTKSTTTTTKSPTDLVFSSDSFLDCPNLVVNCELENSNPLISTSSLVSPSDLLLATVDQTHATDASDLTVNKSQPTQHVQLSSTNQQLSKNQNLNSNLNQNSLLATAVLVVNENGQLTAVNQPTGVVHGFSSSFDSRQIQAAASFPLNARVLVIENLAQLSELTTGGQNLILTASAAAPLAQKANSSFDGDHLPNNLRNHKEKTCEPSSVISHSNSTNKSSDERTDTSTAEKKCLQFAKRPLKRQLAIDDNDNQNDEKRNSSSSPANDEQTDDHVLVIKELNFVDSLNSSCKNQLEKAVADRRKANDDRPVHQTSAKSTDEAMLDATDFRGVLNAAAIAAISEHQNTYQQLNGRLSPNYGQQLGSAQSQLAAASQQYATLQPLPPISTMSDKFTHHYVLNGNHGNNASSAGNQSVIGATNCASNAVHSGFSLMPNTTLGKLAIN